jgi:GST-like protein
MIDLYFYVSPNVRKVLIALEETGLRYTTKWVDIRRGEQFTEDYLAINPNGKVPAIVDHDGPGGRPLALFESGAILLYLAEKTGQLLPRDPASRWEAIAWLFWQMAHLGPISGQAAHFCIYAPQQDIVDPYAIDRYTRETARLYGVLETRLADRDYLADEYSLADIACFPWVLLTAEYEIGIDLAAYPAVAAWSARIAARPAAQVTGPDLRDAAAKANRYTAEQFATLFRSRTDATAGHPAAEGD